METVISKMTDIMQKLEEARFRIEVEIMKEYYTYKKAETLEDIEHNLEVLRRITYRKIEKSFYEEEVTNHFFRFYTRLGIGIVSRNQDNKFITVFDPIA